MTASAAVPAGRDVPLDQERADVYALALELHALVVTSAARGGRQARAQLERASLSVALWIAEATGRAPGLERRRFVQMARGSAGETAELLDHLRVHRLIDSQVYSRARALITRVVRTLARLSPSAREPTGELRLS